MEPEIIEGKWYVVETTIGTEYIPHDVVGDIELHQNSEPMFIAETAPKLRDYCEGDPQEAELINGFGARLSMPGYMDCTDWIVCDSLDEAKHELSQAYDLCETCLGELDEDYRCHKCEPVDEKVA
jgi:hypothetical protein